MKSTEENVSTSSIEIPEKVNILVVDDRPDNIISLTSILEEDSRNLLTATSGHEALRLALENDIAVMLLDVQMPEMDGFEVARLLKENSRTKDISIIFVTAISKEEKFTMQGYGEGAVDYLYKPLDVNIVKAKVTVFEKLYRQREELKRTNERLHKTNKQLDEFVYIVSHDLKAPLRGISSLCSFIEEEVGNPSDDLKELLDLMRSRLGRMQGMIDGILHYSRMSNSTGPKKEVNTKDLITNIIDLISPADNISIEFPDTMPVLHTESIKLHEVFQNLISNGIKYNNKENGVVRVSFLDFPDHVEFTVEDNGIGIKEEHFEKIFQLFQTLVPKDKDESTGLGLTIVKKIVEQQGGKVSVESKVGEGSKFRFTWMKQAS